MEKPIFQAIGLTFKDPTSNEEYSGFLVGKSFLPAALIQRWQESGKGLGEFISGMKIIPPADLEDLAAFPELEELLDALADGIQAAAGDET